jgi:hypothetical protein
MFLVGNGYFVRVGDAVEFGRVFGNGGAGFVIDVTPWRLV